MTRPVIDACLFAGEADMLELRLRTLAPVVDHCVVVACTMTHQGEPADREFIIAGFVRAYAAAARAPRVVPASLHWVTPSRVLERQSGRLMERAPAERGPAGSPWFQHIEKQHRNAVADAVAEVTDNPDTVVMVSDVDEIPDPVVVDPLRAWPGTGHEDMRLVFAQRFHSGALDMLHPIQPWWGTCVSRLEGMNAQQHRNDRSTIGMPDGGQNVIVWDRGGWHFSWFGSDTERERKLRTFSHAELVGKLDVIEARKQNLHSNGEQLIAITAAESELLDWPAPLIDGSFPVPACWLSDDALGQVLDPKPEDNPRGEP